MIFDVLMSAGDEAPWIDATALALMSIFGGVGITVLAGLFGAWLQSRREHRSWLRQRRFEAYVSAFSLVKTFDLNWSKTTKILATLQKSIDESATSGREFSPEELARLEDDEARAMKLADEADELYRTVAPALAPIILLGPPSVARHIYDMQAAYEARDDDAMGAAEVAFQEAARKVLKASR